MRPISDLINFTTQQKLECMPVFIAFDSLEWDFFFFKTLDTFRFGCDFKTWVKILCTSPAALLIMATRLNSLS